MKDIGRVPHDLTWLASAVEVADSYPGAMAVQDVAKKAKDCVEDWPERLAGRIEEQRHSVAWQERVGSLVRIA